MKAVAGLVFLVAAVLADNGCPQDQTLNWEIEKLLPHPECNKFYKCAHGQPIEMRCPSILYFNEETLTCDWPSAVNCAGRQLPRTPEEIVEPVAGLIGIHKNVKDTVLQESQDDTNNGTDDNASEAETEQEIESPEEDTTPESSTPVPIELQENGCPVDPLIHWLVPHEDDCALFYYCIWGAKILRQCTPNTHFNRELQVCDWPEEAGCLTSFNKHSSSRQVMVKNLK